MSKTFISTPEVVLSIGVLIVLICIPAYHNGFGEIDVGFTYKASIGVTIISSIGAVCGLILTGKRGYYLGAGMASIIAVYISCKLAAIDVTVFSWTIVFISVILCKALIMAIQNRFHRIVWE